MTDRSPIDERIDNEALRARAAVLLLQARAQMADIQRALGAVTGDSALQSQLAAAAAQMGRKAHRRENVR
jgi:hypothetical protein